MGGGRRGKRERGGEGKEEGEVRRRGERRESGGGRWQKERVDRGWKEGIVRLGKKKNQSLSLHLITCVSLM